MATTFDLKLAWRRIAAERPNQGFVHHPFERKLVEINVNEWLERLAADLASGSYAPTALQIANAPKGKGHVRPGAILCLRDRAVYYACMHAILPYIRKAVSWPKEQIDFSYQLTKSSDLALVEWFRDPYGGWTNFRRASLAKLEEHSYAVIADITGYYENIDLATLRSDLADCGAPDDATKQLMTCLNEWAQVPGRGIPQGQAPSDILGKLYLNSVDQKLNNDGYSHVRYVDDLRVFCNHDEEGKRVLVLLSELLRRRGLNLQSAKSAIHRADAASQIFDGITPIIESVQKRYIADLVKRLELEPYTPWDKIEKILEASPDEVPVVVLRETFSAYFLGDPTSFDKTLFHYLIKRLRLAKDQLAVDHCLLLLERQPQETSYILRYFVAVSAVDRVLPGLVSFINSSHGMVYEYQLHQILEWAKEFVPSPPPELISCARRYAFEVTKGPAYLRSTARSFLAEHGNRADFESFESHYASVGSSLEQAEVMCCVRRLDKGRRNSFLARSESDGDWNKRAATLVRTS